MPELERFIDAQEGQTSFPTFKKAFQEIQNGKKQSHWIWYVLPQLKSLGLSQIAQYYGINDFHEACEYLQNKTLFQNYHKMIQLILKQLDNRQISALMNGAVDAQKLASSLTLFQSAAEFLIQNGNTKMDYAALFKDCRLISDKIKLQNYPPCERTLIWIRREKEAIAQKKPRQPLI